LPELPLRERRPDGVTAIAMLFLLAAAYLIVVGGLMLSFPGWVSMTAGSALLNGLELAGPFMFLLIGATGLGIGIGLSRLNNWARRLAIIAAMLGAIMLIPAVSAAAVDFHPSLLWTGLGVVIRVAMVWYLYQAPVSEAFRKSVRYEQKPW